MKFYRTEWRYPEPTYYTVHRYRPANDNQRAKVWGKLTWRGVEEKSISAVTGSRKAQWRYVVEDWPPADFETLQTQMDAQIVGEPEAAPEVDAEAEAEAEEAK
jgi:hypothetical protein